MPIIYYSHYSVDAENDHTVTAREHKAGRLLLKAGLNDLYGFKLDYRETNDIDELLAFKKRGKPYLKDYPDIFFNISHSKGLIVCAFDDHAVGVDTELLAHFSDIFIKRIFSESEIKMLYEQGQTIDLKREWFYRLWTLKEAFVKRNGQGVASDLKGFYFSFDFSSMPLKIRCSERSVSCFQEKLPSGHIVSLCYTKDKAPVTLVNKQIAPQDG